MSSLAISGIVFACVFGGTLLGILLRRALPEHHLSADSKDTLKLGMGVIGTMGALVLGLTVGSAKSSYDTQKSEVTQMAAKIVLLDRTLAHYGPDTKGAREMLRGFVTRMIEQIWSDGGSQQGQLDPLAAGGEALFDAIHELTPTTDAQRSLKAQALTITVDIGNMRWLMFAQAGKLIFVPFLVMLVSWFTVTFLGFGLFAPRNLTVIAAFLLCALSVSGAIFLVLELDHPFHGLIQISSDPLRSSLAQLGR